MTKDNAVDRFHPLQENGSSVKNEQYGHCLGSIVFLEGVPISKVRMQTQQHFSNPNVITLLEKTVNASTPQLLLVSFSFRTQPKNGLQKAEGWVLRELFIHDGHL